MDNPKYTPSNSGSNFGSFLGWSEVQIIRYGITRNRTTHKTPNDFSVVQNKPCVWFESKSLQLGRADSLEDGPRGLNWTVQRYESGWSYMKGGLTMNAILSKVTFYFFIENYSGVSDPGWLRTFRCCTYVGKSKNDPQTITVTSQ